MKLNKININLTSTEAELWAQILEIKEAIERKDLPWYKRIFA